MHWYENGWGISNWTRVWCIQHGSKWKIQMVAWDCSWWYHIWPTLSCRLSPPHWHKNRWSWCDRNPIWRLLWHINSREWRWNTNGSLSRTTFTMEVSRRSNFPTWQMHLCYSTVLQEGPSIQSSDGRVFLCWTKVWRKVQILAPSEFCWMQKPCVAEKPCRKALQLV